MRRFTPELLTHIKNAAREVMTVKWKNGGDCSTGMMFQKENLFPVSREQWIIWKMKRLGRQHWTECLDFRTTYQANKKVLSLSPFLDHQIMESSRIHGKIATTSSGSRNQCATQGWRESLASPLPLKAKIEVSAASSGTSSNSFVLCRHWSFWATVMDRQTQLYRSSMNFPSLYFWLCSKASI